MYRVFNVCLGYGRSVQVYFAGRPNKSSRDDVHHVQICVADCLNPEVSFKSTADRHQRTLRIRSQQRSSK